MRVGGGIFHRVSHAGLCAEVHDIVRFEMRDQPGEFLRLGKIALDETKILQCAELGEPRALECDGVVVADIVHAEYLAALGFREPARDMVADEAGGAGHEDFHFGVIVGCALRGYDKIGVNFSKTVLDCAISRPLPCSAFAFAYAPCMNIKAYLKPSCGWSNGVRAIMRKYNLAFEDIDIINNRDNYAEMVQKSGQPLSPCVEVDGVMLADVSGEEVENYLLSNDLVKPTDSSVDTATNAGCSDEEHAKMATKTIRFF